MRLKTIKLAGFKSFVDPTIVPIKTNLTAVVGPNGCGKSNIIDAVRWVMGESSAKQLRGEALTDVIFNGAASRKPVGQASIDLIFDNADGAIGGAYASYGEIAVRREVNREAMSHYYLNNTRCRRKDITDVFLGTGLGSRSYSIIEQGMISQLIEAKPEELRVHLEEAAGISKYKERRRETENRIRRTKDNISRLKDIIDEINKQLERLKRQSRAAERYKVLKEEERVLKAQLLALRWEEGDAAVKQHEGKIKTLEIQLESKIAEQRTVDATIERLRDQQTEQNDAFHEVQGRYYRVGAEIARIEQRIQHGKERRTQLEQDLAELEESWQEAQQHQTDDSQQLQDLNDELTALEPQRNQAVRQADESQTRLSEVEQSLRNWQDAWDSFNTSAAEAVQCIEVEQTRIQHLEQKINNITQRIEKNEKEKSEVNFENLPEEIDLLTEHYEKAKSQSDSANTEISQITEQISIQRTENIKINTELAEARGQLQRLEGKQASLEALQEIALGKQTSSALDWLKQHQLDARPRLAQLLEVESGWERAVEAVLQSRLEAVYVDDIGALASVLDDFSGESLMLFESRKDDRDNSLKNNRLSCKVKADIQIFGFLNTVLCAGSLAEAYALRSQLADHESVVTRDGVLLGPHWIRFTRGQDEKSGVIQRERELHQVASEIEAQRRNVAEMEEMLAQAKIQIEHLESQREQTQQGLTQSSAQLSDVYGQLSAKKTRLDHLRQRQTRLTEELSQDHLAFRDAEQQLAHAEQVLDEAMVNRAADSGRREQLKNEQSAIRMRLELTREQARTDRKAADEIAIRVESTRSQLQFLQQNIDRVVQQINGLRDKRAHISGSIADAESPLAQLSQELQLNLERHLLLESEMNSAKHTLETVEHELRQAEASRNHAEEAVQSVRSQLEQVRMEWQGLEVRRSTFNEQIKEFGFVLEELLEQIPKELTHQTCEEKLEGIAKRISRLGPINLAAIEEFDQESERKTYLDKQHEDLTEALTTLENAIRKIDRETRTRFKDTFERVNQSFNRFFPKIFGGGKASLQLMGDDLLDTGVSIVAQPPGKRNATIHLLSGGEKALTAIALVFSIFELNPAPFCMLDEVDAPLDDANIERFCQLVKEMSDRIQFIFITHNKGTMELADQLVGVTMHEPGVSRLVSVDIEEAMALAE